MLAVFTFGEWLQAIWPPETDTLLLERVEESETPQMMDAWVRTLDLIEALNPLKIIPGHIEEGWELDAKADLAHNRKYLDLFAEKVIRAEQKPKVDDYSRHSKTHFRK